LAQAAFLIFANFSTNQIEHYPRADPVLRRPGPQ
jgi:hypothetical protein